MSLLMIYVCVEICTYNVILGPLVWISDTIDRFLVFFRTHIPVPFWSAKVFRSFQVITPPGCDYAPAGTVKLSQGERVAVSPDITQVRRHGIYHNGEI